MAFKYRVQGRAKESFIIRGMLFKANEHFDFCFSEKEVEFVKKNSNIEKVIDLEAKETPVQVEAPKAKETPAAPVLEPAKKVITKQGGSNVKQGSKNRPNNKNKA